MVAQVGLGGQRPDQGHRAALRQRQQPPPTNAYSGSGVMLQQHDRLAGRLARQGPVGWAAAQGHVIAAGRHTQLGPQQPQHGIVDAAEGHRPCGHRLAQLRLKQHPKRHLQIEARQHGLDPITEAKDEIAHHKAPKTPAALEDLIEQLGVLATPFTVDFVVGAHHRQGARLHAVPKLGQIELVQHPRRNAHIHPEAGAIDRIEGEVLHAGDPMALNAPGDGGPHGAHMEGIFAVGLLGPAPARVTQQVHTHGCEQVGPEGASLLGHGHADPLFELHIPAGTTGQGHRKGGGAPLEHHPPRPIHKPQAAGRPRVAMQAIAQHRVGHALPIGQIALEAIQLLRQAQLAEQGPGSGLQAGVVMHPFNVRRSGVLEISSQHWLQECCKAAGVAGVINGPGAALRPG